MVNINIINTYLASGKRLTLLNGKIPAVQNWTEKELTRDAILAHKGNLGWVIDNKHLVIDVDPKNGGFESFERLKMALGIELEPTVITPSGGYHIYTKLPNDSVGIKLRKNVKAYKGIDFLSVGTQCVIAGCVTEKGEYRFYDDFIEDIEGIETPLSIINLIKDNRINGDSDSGSDDDLGFMNKIDNRPADDVQSMLNKLDPNCDYEVWIKIGLACHTWHKEKGFDIWDKWSQGGITYNADTCVKKWNDFNVNNRGEITLGTLGYMVKELSCDTKKNKLNRYIELISEALDYKEIELNIAQKIKKENFDNINLEILIKKIQMKIKEFSGVNVPVKDVRDLFGKTKKKSDIATGTFIEDNGNVPEWCNDWIYVLSLNGMWNLKEYELETITSFNLICGVHVPYKEGSESKPYAMKYVSDNGFIKKVTGSVYMPSSDDLFININNSKYLNTFNKNSIPNEASFYSEGGYLTINMIEKHIDFICSGNKTNSKILTEWIAHQLQYIGKKILWSPIIQGIQGIGKTAFAEILKACLGDINVGIVSPNQVISDFNSWATDKCVNVLEELRIAGKSRHDCVNALKPLITDRMIQINSKGVKQYNTYNTTNYICFTNYKDAIPLDEGDRRWFVIFAEIDHVSQIKDKLGMESTEYFNLLFSNIREYAGEIRKFFLEYEISNEFFNMKTAPMTDYKAVMISSQNAKYEGLEELKELIDVGGEFYNNTAVCPVELFNALLLEHEILITGIKEKNFLLSKLGYLNLGKPFKIKGKSRRVWAKKPMTNEQVQKCFYGAFDLIEDF